MSYLPTGAWYVNKIGKKLIENTNNDGTIKCNILEIKIFSKIATTQWPEHMCLKEGSYSNKYCLTLIDKIPVNESEDEKG
jgi:hypothetical protein